ncbi:MAG: PEP-CTERM system TPR-repeat protein PrsT [Halioglobus sp.]|nr:PEP-CTERM system TPR-repeat protein PrsT [Halioglobus sp.]
MLLTLTLTAGCTGKSSEEHIALAEESINGSRYGTAVIELKNAIRKDPASARARWLLGQAYLATGDLESAAKELHRARELGWPREQVLPVLARVLLAQGEYGRVSELPADDLEGGPRAELMAAQALSEYAQGEARQAGKLIKRALKLAPALSYVRVAQARIRFAEQDYSGALAASRKALAGSPDAAEAWSVSGDVYLQQGEYEQALEAFSKAIKHQPYSPADRLKRGLIRLQSHQYDGALADARVLLGYSAANPGGNYVKGAALFQQGRYADALRPLSLAEPAWKTFPLALFFLGAANLMQDNLEQAASYATKFHNAVPQNVAGRKLLATIRLKQKDYPAVEELLSPVLEEHPDDTDTLTLMANALLFNNRVDAGIALLERVAQLQPASAQARIRLGTGLILGGDSTAANTHLETALDLDPEFQQAGVLLILSHLQERDYAAAIEAAKSHLQRHPNDVMSHNLLGKAYLENGETARAREAFERALQRAPGDPFANHQLAALALEAGQPDAARGYYDTVLEHHRNHLATLVQLALLEATAGNEDRVVEHMERAMTAHPTALEPRLLLGRYYLATGKPERLSPLFATLDSRQRRSPKVMLLLALSQISDADNINAQYTLEELLRSTPETPQTHHLLAMAVAGTGDEAAARQSLQAALALDPEFLPARLALARMDLADRALDDLRQHLQVLLELAPTTPDVLQLQAAMAAIEQRPTAAVAFSRQAFALAPGTHSALELAHYLSSAGDTGAANQLLLDWVTEHPSDQRVRLALAGQLQQSGRHREALAQYEAALETDPRSVIALTRLSQALRDSAPEKALALAERASEFAPDAPEVLDSLAMAAYASGDYARAGVSVRRAIMKAPDNPAYRYHNALILVAQGNTNSAVAALEQLLDGQAQFAEQGKAERLLGELNSQQPSAR